MTNSRKKWLGGYRREGKKGPTYVIERWVGGRYFHVSTKCRTERAALKHLERFEEDPETYSPKLFAAAPARTPLFLTKPMVLELCEWMRTRERPASERWIYHVGHYLSHWMTDLAGVDLRDVTVHGHLRPALDKRKTRQHRVEVIKVLYGWLRKEKGLLRHAEDPTLDLPVPKPAPEKHKRKKVVEPARVLAALEKMREESRDVLELRLATAWHLTEVVRFAASGEILPVAGDPRVIAVLITRHKSGKETRTPLQHKEHLEAAKRIRARGQIPTYKVIANDLKVACKAAGVERFTAGVIRHSVLTWAVERGASPREVAEFAGHSEATSRRFYIDVAVPTVAVPVLRVIDGKKKKA